MRQIKLTSKPGPLLELVQEHLYEWTMLFLLSIVKTAIVSGIVSSSLVALRTGIGSGFLSRWLGVYVFTFPAAWSIKHVFIPAFRHRKNIGKSKK